MSGEGTGKGGSQSIKEKNRPKVFQVGKEHMVVELGCGEKLGNYTHLLSI